jgi:hypothetical protein
MITLVLSTPMSIPLVLVIYIIGSILIMGFYGNYLYVGHIHSKIDKGYHLCSLQNTSAIAALIFWLTCFKMPVYLLINLIIYFSDKRKVEKVLEEKVRTYP